MRVSLTTGNSQYLLLSNIKWEEWTQLLSKLNCNFFCELLREDLLTRIEDINEFLHMIYDESDLTKYEIENKVEVARRKCQGMHVIYLYILQCKEKRIFFNSGHSENYYVRKIKNEFREREAMSWVHSTDTDSETRELLRKIKNYENRQ